MCAPMESLIATAATAQPPTTCERTSSHREGAPTLRPEGTGLLRFAIGDDYVRCRPNPSPMIAPRIALTATMQTRVHLLCALTGRLRK